MGAKDFVALAALVAMLGVVAWWLVGEVQGK